MGIIFKLIAFLTLFISLVVIFAGPLSQIGLWDWLTGFTIMQKGAPVLMAGAALSLAGIIYAFIAKKSGIILPSMLAVLFVGATLYALLSMRSIGAQHPIHDITTDMIDPPTIIAGAKFERLNPPEYVGAIQVGKTGKTVSQIQTDLYPNLKTQSFNQPFNDTYNAALETAKSMGWEILDQNPATGTIEATFKSRWFGFIDDIVIRVRSNGSQSQVDIRSKSRVGRSDLGANSKRIIAYQNAIAARL